MTTAGSKISTREIRAVVRRIMRNGEVPDESAVERVRELMLQLPFTDAEVDLLWDTLDDDPGSRELDHEAIAKRVVRRANGEEDDDGLAGVPVPR